MYACPPAPCAHHPKSVPPRPASSPLPAAAGPTAGACKFDLRFVPEEQSFEGRQVRDSAADVPPDYEPPTFQTKVRLLLASVQELFSADSVLSLCACPSVLCCAVPCHACRLPPPVLYTCPSFTVAPLHMAPAPGVPSCPFCFLPIFTALLAVQVTDCSHCTYDQ